MMESEQSPMMDILDLTLEIIYLLTGEDYKVVKRTYGDHGTSSSCAHASERWRRCQSPIMVPPPSSILTSNNNKKIIDVIQKMMELLTGEVPMRCQDVSVNFSMDNKDYLEEYKDIIMEDHQSLKSPDGSRGPTERCPRPLDFQDSTQEPQEIPQHDQNKMLTNLDVETIKEELYVNGDDLCKEEESPPEISPAVGWETSKSSDSFPEDKDIRSNSPTETAVTPNLQIERGLSSSSNCNVDSENIALGFPSPILHPGLPSAHVSLDPPTHGHPDRVTADCTVDALFVCSGCVKWFLLKLPPEEYETINSHKIPFMCPDCGKHITQEKGLQRPRKADKETYECSECGKHFSFNSELVRHRLSHTGEKPHQCVECGKRFRQRGSLREHQKMHYGNKLFSCSECDSCFTRKMFLLNHQRTHTGEKPFSCSECGRCFAQEAGLFRHQVVHTGVKPYTCMDCGKSFAHKSSFMTHRRTHTGGEPYPCSECGKRFKQKSYLVDHFRLHTGEKPYSCAECGERFTCRLFLRKHEQIHTGLTWLPCLDCGKRFTGKRLLKRHQKIHTADKLSTGPLESQAGFSQKSELSGPWRTHAVQEQSLGPESGVPFTMD